MVMTVMMMMMVTMATMMMMIRMITTVMMVWMLVMTMTMVMMVTDSGDRDGENRAGDIVAPVTEATMVIRYIAVTTWADAPAS